MSIKILAFGQIAEIVGRQQWEEPRLQNTGAVVRQLKEQFPELRSLKFTVAVNKNIVQENMELNENDTVALLPPFSGG